MGNSSSFNTCSRCGSANTLSAKYCYQCGAQLKVPEEPKACSKCGTINTGLSNYCRKCGAVLTANTLVKYCPQCRRQVVATQQVCDCGYSFVEGNANQVIKPSKKNKKKDVVASASAPVHYDSDVAVATMDQPYQPFEVASNKPVKATKTKAGGRLGAFVSFIFILAFAYIMFAPTQIRWDTLYKAVPLYVDAQGVANGNWFDILWQAYQGFFVNKTGFPKDVHTITLYVMLGIALFFMALHLLVALFRIIAGKKGKAKRSNILYLVMFLITGVGSCLLFFAKQFDFLKMFVAPTGAVSYLVFAIPAYFFLFWFVSLFTKKEKKTKKPSKKAK